MKPTGLLLAAALLLVACSSVPKDASGEQIYATLCARCHGADLQGGVGPPLGPGSSAAQAPDSYLEETILRGRGRMPSFQGALDSGQVERLIRYLRERQT
jgi:mono/diheme cytochrome c family protein